MVTLLRALVVSLGLVALGGTLLSLSKGSHWLLRLWDFPRTQLAAAAAFSGAVFRAFFFRGRPADWLFVIANALCVTWQGRKIFPYTPLARVQVMRSSSQGKDGRTFRLLIANVQMENREHARLLEVVRENEPDLFMAVEVDAAWARALEPLAAAYPHVVRQVQENYYGLMLFSALRLIEPRVDFLVQHDVPSVHACVELRSGDRVYLHGLHPRPPEPIRDQDSTPRDAELVIVGRMIREAGSRPTVVAGDLNDVAWSPTSELFLRLSGLLDPRVGRGFYNSFHADKRLLRYPLDHVFHSNHFKVVALRRLRHIGSDHFPMFIELSYEPEVQAEQPAAELEHGDQEAAEEKLDDQAEAARTGDDRPAEER